MPKRSRCAGSTGRKERGSAAGVGKDSAASVIGDTRVAASAVAVAEDAISVRVGTTGSGVDVAVACSSGPGGLLAGLQPPMLMKRIVSRAGIAPHTQRRLMLKSKAS